MPMDPLMTPFHQKLDTQKDPAPKPKRIHDLQALGSGLVPVQ